MTDYLILAAPFVLVVIIGRLHAAEGRAIRAAYKSLEVIRERRAMIWKQTIR
jgi:hypothetical protein